MIKPKTIGQILWVNHGNSQKASWSLKPGSLFPIKAQCRLERFWILFCFVP